MQIIKYFTIAGIAGVLAASCATREEYHRNTESVNENLFRTQRLPKDSVRTAQVSWRQIFTDPVLQRHISSALENNLDVKIAIQNINAAEAYLKQRKAAYEPTISVGPSYSVQSPSVNSQIQNFGRAWRNVFGLSADVAWDADIWGRMKAEERAQAEQYFSSMATQNAVKADLVSAVATAYFQLLTYDEQKQFINRQIKIRKENLETTKALKTAGVLTEVAVQQSEALVYNAESLLITVDVQIAQLENAISIMKGEAPHEIERTTLAQQKLPADYELGFPAQLLENRPDVAAAEYQLRSAFELTNAAHAQFYPNLRISGSGGLQSFDIDKFFSANSLFASVVGSLVQPILNKRQIRTNYEISLINREKAYLNFRKTLLSAGREVADAMTVFRTQDSFIALKEKELFAYNQSVQYSQELVNYGMANYLEVLNASVSALNAELNISNARFAKMKAQIDLYRALGGGWR